MRVVYYDIAGKILEKKRQVIPCYAGISNVHINYDGGVWPCCVLGYEKEMGNLRDYNYDFQKLWKSKKAEAVRNYIREKNCACPLANPEIRRNIIILLILAILVLFCCIIFCMKTKYLNILRPYLNKK